MFHQLRIARKLCMAGAMLTVSGGSLGLFGAATHADSVTPGSTAVAANSPYSTAGKNCDPNRNGYHFIMNGLEYPAGSVIDAADFGPINITFSNGTTAVASFTDLAGGQTAHFLNSTVNQSGNFTISSATMTFPAGSDITGFGNFVISHPPCGTTTTVTTTTTTTVTPTTTTTVTPTTTTVTPTTTTTLVLSVVPSLPTTTTLVGSQGALPTTTTPVGNSLPATGTEGQTAIFGLFVLTCGLTMLGLARRRTVRG